MSPQPFWPLAKNNEVPWIVPQALGQRPELAGLVMQVISTWSHIDAEYAVMLAAFLKSDHDVVCSMLEGIVSTEARRGAVMSAARAALSADAFDFFRAVDRAAAPSRRKRHKFAHGIWGYVEEWPDRLLFVDGKEYMRDDFALERWAEVEGADPRTYPGDPGWRRVLVYHQSELEADALEAYECWDWANELRGLCHGDNAATLQAHEIPSHLLAEPRLQRAWEKERRQHQGPG